MHFSSCLIFLSSCVSCGILPRHFRYLRKDLGCLTPKSVLGGVTTFLFANVAASGIRVLAFVRFTRQERFILLAALSFGVGNLLKPDILGHLFEGVKNPTKGARIV